MDSIIALFKFKKYNINMSNENDYDFIIPGMTNCTSVEKFLKISINFDSHRNYLVGEKLLVLDAICSRLNNFAHNSCPFDMSESEFIWK